MLDTYEIMPFDNKDGGVWKQGWPITYDTSKAESKQLKVFVIPHSHCDPGWIKTFEGYYKSQVVNILNNMVEFLSNNPQMKFIYAEMSFFERWWRDIDNVKRNAVRKLVSNGQLEIVTGAWVMTDEANAHYYSMLDQMIEGHEFLREQLDYKPTNHWSIDPFGLSANMAYLVSRSNFSAMTLQRVHYSVKKQLAKTKQLEFYWRQLFAGSSKSTDILSHIFPFYSYDVPHTCGPEPAICCTFDFKRLPGGGVGCPWNKPPVPITRDNVAQRAATLLDQYRKKSELYRSNVVLIPLGDDFRYDTAMEWQNQYENYRKLFEYMNSNFNVKAQFGTLHDYFTALRADLPNLEDSYQNGYNKLPVLTGDFFTYADRDDHYWSGYYTSRPFYKRMERVLMHYLRSTEIIYSWTTALLVRSASTGIDFELLYAQLVDARRQLAVFQHHDGITGTAKDPVVNDYGERMHRSIEACKNIIAQCSHFLLTPSKSRFEQPKAVQSLLAVDETRSSYDSLPTKTVFRVTVKPRALIFYNSLLFERYELACVHVDRLSVVIKDAGGRQISAQIEPVFRTSAGSLAVQPNEFKVCFLVTIPAVGLARYELTLGDGGAVKATIAANYQVALTDFDQTALPDNQFSVESADLNVVFSTKTGYLKSVTDRAQSSTHNVNLEFVTYGARRKGQGGIKGGDSLSGAYLFLPDGQAKPLTSAIKGHPVVVLSGVYKSTVYVQLPTVLHTITVHHNPVSHEGQVLHITNIVDVTQEHNYELSMRLKTEIDSKDLFYTDLNAMQMLKRKRFGKIPLQGHFYPMPAAAYIEDSKTRMSLMSAQPLGVSSLESGFLEVILDRRLNQDDDRGLFQGVTDNRVTPDVFRLCIESLKAPAMHENSKLGVHTLLAEQSYRTMIHPLISMYSREVHDLPDLLPSMSLFQSNYVPACDIHLVNLRTLTASTDYSNGGQVTVKPKQQQAMILHRRAVMCQSNTSARVKCTSSENFALDAFNEVMIKVDEETSATLMHSVGKLTDEKKITMLPMELRTFRKLHRRDHVLRQQLVNQIYTAGESSLIFGSIRKSSRREPIYQLMCSEALIQTLLEVVALEWNTNSASVMDILHQVPGIVEKAEQIHAVRWTSEYKINRRLDTAKLREDLNSMRLKQHYKTHAKSAVSLAINQLVRQPKLQPRRPTTLPVTQTGNDHVEVIDSVPQEIMIEFPQRLEKMLEFLYSSDRTVHKMMEIYRHRESESTLTIDYLNSLANMHKDVAWLMIHFLKYRLQFFKTAK